MQQNILPVVGSLSTIYRRHWVSFLALSLLFTLVFSETVIIAESYFRDKDWSDPNSILIGILVGISIFLIQLLLTAVLQIGIADLISNTSPLPKLSSRLSLALGRYSWPVFAAMLLNVLCLAAGMLLSVIMFPIFFPVVLVFASAGLTIGFLVVLGQLSPLAAIKKVIMIGRKYGRDIFIFSLTLDVVLFLLVLLSLGSRYDELALATTLQLTWLATFVYGLIAPGLAWIVSIELNSDREIKSEFQPAVNPVG